MRTPRKSRSRFLRFLQFLWTGRHNWRSKSGAASPARLLRLRSGAPFFLCQFKGAALDYQALFNIVIGILGVIAGWLLNAMWAGLKDLQVADTKLAEKVAAIEVLVAGQYITREEFTVAMNSVFSKLDKIQDSINKKADR